jgi:hypothetical protein
MPFLLFGFGLNASTVSHCRHEQHHLAVIGVAASSRAFLSRIASSSFEFFSPEQRARRVENREP